MGAHGPPGSYRASQRGGGCCLLPVIFIGILVFSGLVGILTAMLFLI